MRAHLKEGEREVSQQVFSLETQRGPADSSHKHGCRKSQRERAELIAQAFMKERALIYSKSFTSPLRMWSDERSETREERKGGIQQRGQG